MGVPSSLIQFCFHLPCFSEWNFVMDSLGKENTIQKQATKPQAGVKWTHTRSRGPERTVFKRGWETWLPPWFLTI